MIRLGGPRRAAHRGKREIAIELHLLRGSQGRANLLVSADKRLPSLALEVVPDLHHALPSIHHDEMNLLALSAGQMHLVVHPRGQALARDVQKMPSIGERAGDKADQEACDDRDRERRCM